MLLTEANHNLMQLDFYRVHKYPLLHYIIINQLIIIEKQLNKNFRVSWKSNIINVHVTQLGSHGLKFDLSQCVTTLVKQLRVN